MSYLQTPYSQDTQVMDTSNKKRTGKMGGPYRGVKKRKTYRKKTNRAKSLVVRGCYGFPDKMTTKLKYVQQVDFNSAPEPAAQIWRVNSCYDPDASGTGHQPSYFDTYASIYDEYKVTGCSVEMEIINQSSTAVKYAYGWFDNQPSLGTPACDNLRETKYGNGGVLAVANGGLSVTKIRTYMDIAKLNGEPNLNDKTFQARVTANPGDVSWFYFVVSASDGSTNIGVQVRFTLTYYVTFMDQKDPGTS